MMNGVQTMSTLVGNEGRYNEYKHDKITFSRRTYD